jgi:hypothetical protein
VSNCCLTPNEQYEEFDISKNFGKLMLPREYSLSHYDSSPPLTACKILVIVIDSSFVEQV